MNRTQIYAQIEQQMGLVPTFLKLIPDSSLELEWQLMQRLEMEEGTIPGKYRDLMGIAIAATARCPFCTYFHTAMARLQGATDAEIEEAVHFAKASAGWSTYINGMQIDIAQFRQEVDLACNHIRTQMASGATPPRQKDVMTTERHA